MAGIDVVLVIYNKALAQSQSAATLNAPSDARVHIVDNSTSDFGNREFAQEYGYEYVDMGGNAGLSRAYNRVIDTLEKDDGLLCLFDDDTEVDSRYFEALKKAAEAHPEIDVFAPVVTDQKGIMSPCIIRGVSCRRMSLTSCPSAACRLLTRAGGAPPVFGLPLRRRAVFRLRDHAFLQTSPDMSGRAFIYWRTSC